MRARARRRSGSKAAGRRRGSTLVEQMVALSVLSVGLLAVSAVGDALNRRARHAALGADAMSVAARWREMLVAAACEAPPVGTVTDGPFQVGWTAAPSGRTVAISVTATELAAGADPSADAPVSHQLGGTARCAQP